MNASVVLFKDEEGKVDFGLLIPDFGIICLCCGSLFVFGEVEILYDFTDVRYLEQAVASGGFYDELPDELQALYTGEK